MSAKFMPQPSLMPSAKSLFEEALRRNPKLDIDELHEAAYRLMMKYRERYYETKVNSILDKLSIPKDLHAKILSELLRPVVVNERGKSREYSNVMEATSRRISQSFQPISGTLAELCAQRELERHHLLHGINFTRRENRTDFTIYYPSIQSPKAKHRIEIKNVSLRERGIRGLKFDGDSLLGFFNQSEEFTSETVSLFDESTRSTGGYCYVPQKLIEEMKHIGERFKPNTEFGKDMLYFSLNGKIT